MYHLQDIDAFDIPVRNIADEKKLAVNERNQGTSP